MSRPVRTAVFPVAGRGTRFLPATKAMPKEMLPIVDKPLVQYAVEEALAAGVTRLVFVTGSSKRAIEDHFDRDPELERALGNAGKEDLLEVVRAILPAGVSCVYIRQGEPLGLGHAVLCAMPAVGDEAFLCTCRTILFSQTPAAFPNSVLTMNSMGLALLPFRRWPLIKPGNTALWPWMQTTDS